MITTNPLPDISLNLSEISAKGNAVSATVVLCTATQADFVENEVFPAGTSVRDIVQNYRELAEKMKRGEIVGSWIQNHR